MNEPNALIAITMNGDNPKDKLHRKHEINIEGYTETVRWEQGLTDDVYEIVAVGLDAIYAAANEAYDVDVPISKENAREVYEAITQGKGTSLIMLAFLERITGCRFEMADVTVEDDIQYAYDSALEKVGIAWLDYLEKENNEFAAMLTDEQKRQYDTATKLLTMLFTAAKETESKKEVQNGNETNSTP